MCYILTCIPVYAYLSFPCFLHLRLLACIFTLCTYCILCVPCLICVHHAKLFCVLFSGMAHQIPKCFKHDLVSKKEVSKEDATDPPRKSRACPSSHPPPEIVQALPVSSPKRTRASTKAGGMKKQRVASSSSSQVESHLGSLVTPFLGDDKLSILEEFRVKREGSRQS